MADGYLTIRIMGTDVDGSYVEMTNETWEDSEHYYANSYRNVYDANGNLISSQKEAYSCYDREEVIAARKAAEKAAQEAPAQEVAATDGTVAPPVVDEQFEEPITDPAIPPTEEVYG